MAPEYVQPWKRIRCDSITWTFLSSQVASGPVCSDLIKYVISHIIITRDSKVMFSPGVFVCLFVCVCLYVYVCRIVCPDDLTVQKLVPHKQYFAGT